MQKRFKLKPFKELEKQGYVFRVLSYSDAVILTNKAGSMKSFPLENFNKTYVVDDDEITLSNIEMEAYKDFFVDIKDDENGKFK